MSNKFSELDYEFMGRALVLAKRGFALTKPNPMVGAVLVKNGKIIGEGFHRKAGGNHAEVEALKGLSVSQMAGASLYVTLEPCSHYNKRTPPCCDLLIKSGVKSVFVATKDMNPAVNGEGILRLKNSGIKVRVGLLSTEAFKLNEVFFKSVSTPLPFVVLKMAMTLDGKIATQSGNSKWLTNDKSRQHVHKLRGLYDSVLTSSSTVLADNPFLNVRVPKFKNPLRVIVDRELKTEPNFNVYKDDNVVVAAVVGVPESRLKVFKKAGIKVQVYNRETILKDLFLDLSILGVQSVMIESGGKLAAEFIKQKLIDKFVFFYASKLIGGSGLNSIGDLGISNINDLVTLNDVSVERFDDDIMVEAYPKYKD